LNSTAEYQGACFDTWGASLNGNIGQPASTNFGQLRLGARIVTRDGRVFRFARVGAVAAVAGSVYQAAAAVPNHLAQTPAAAAVGATQVVITTLGATAATENQYAEGYLQVDTTPGNGIMYGINSHLANAGSAAFTVNLEKDDAIQVALTTASRVGLIANPYSAIIVTPTTATNVIVGVPLVAAAINAYCWIQDVGSLPGAHQRHPRCGCCGGQRCDHGWLGRCGCRRSRNQHSCAGHHAPGGCLDQEQRSLPQDCGVGSPQTVIITEWVGYQGGGAGNGSPIPL
jgi:hypothetical protein